MSMEEQDLVEDLKKHISLTIDALYPFLRDKQMHLKSFQEQRNELNRVIPKLTGIN